MANDVNHVLLTRFNLPSIGHESIVRAQENWLRNRVVLFERYCLPSVSAQTSQNFSWIVYFDPGSPAWFLDWIDTHRAQSTFHPILREEVPRDVLIEDIRSVTGGSGECLITTNLDNDDSLATDFVARVQAARTSPARTAIYLSDGLIREGGRVYRHLYPYNPFCSVSEPWQGAVTCWSEWHNLLPDHMPAVVVRGEPGWLQVVHGANVSNRVQGQLTQPARFGALFPGMLDDLPAMSRQDVLRDVLVTGPSRRLRETARSTGKAAITKVAGKQGLDRIKVLMASVRGRGA